MQDANDKPDVNIAALLTELYILTELCNLEPLTMDQSERVADIRDSLGEVELAFRSLYHAAADYRLAMLGPDRGDRATARIRMRKMRNAILDARRFVPGVNV